jgi:hypothetical protein
MMQQQQQGHQPGGPGTIMDDDAAADDVLADVQRLLQGAGIEGGVASYDPLRS